MYDEKAPLNFPCNIGIVLIHQQVLFLSKYDGFSLQFTASFSRMTGIIPSPKDCQKVLCQVPGIQ